MNEYMIPCEQNNNIIKAVRQNCFVDGNMCFVRGSGFFIKCNQEKFYLTAKHNFAFDKPIEEVYNRLIIHSNPDFFTNNNKDTASILSAKRVHFSYIANFCDAFDVDDLALFRVLDNEPDDKYCIDIDMVNNLDFEDEDGGYAIGFPIENAEYEENDNSFVITYKQVVIKLEDFNFTLGNQLIRRYITAKHGMKTLSGMSGGAIVQADKNGIFKIRGICIGEGREGVVLSSLPLVHLDSYFHKIMRPLKIPCQSDSVPYTSGETNERNNKPTATSNSKVRL